VLDKVSTITGFRESGLVIYDFFTGLNEFGIRQGNAVWGVYLFFFACFMSLIPFPMWEYFTIISK
jgi:hypothetical protein